MLSLHGIVPISIQQNQLVQFIQKQIQNEKSISFKKWWGSIDLNSSGLEILSSTIGLKENKLIIFFNIRIPVFYRLLFWKKRTYVNLKSEFIFFVLQTGRQASFALDNSRISYFNVEGIPNLLNNLFTPTIENALEIEITRSLGNLNRLFEELVSKEWQIPFSIESNQHKFYLNIRQVRFASIETENGIVKINLAISIETDLRSRELTYNDFVFLDIATDCRIQITEDILKELLQSYLTTLHIPLISKNIPVAIAELKLTKQFIELNLQFSEWFKGLYFIKLQLLSVQNEMHLHLVEMKSTEKQSFIRKGLGKAIEFALIKIIESTGKLSFSTISTLTNQMIESPLYFKIKENVVKINIPKLIFRAIHQGKGEIDLDFGIEHKKDTVVIEL